MIGRKYTSEERVFIMSYAYGRSWREITDEFNNRFSPPVGINQIAAYLKNHKISTGRTGQFEKGSVPHNKGTHIGGWEPTQFKKGCIPVNHKPVGTESIRISKGKSYVYVKVAEPNKWRMKHIIVWENHYGIIPKGKIIVFLDNDSTNTEIGNLQLIDRAVHARLNQSHLRYSNPELTKTGIGIAEVLSKIGEVKKR